MVCSNAESADPRQVLTNYGESGVNKFNNMFDKLVQEGDRRKFSGR